MDIKAYTEKPTKEYQTYLDLPKTQHLGDYERYPEVPVSNSYGWFKVRKLPCDIFAIAEPYHEQNGCFYLVLGLKKALLFDTGLGIYNPRPLVEELAGEREIIVVNSHMHFDHTGGNHYFDKCYIHVNDIVKRSAENGLHLPNITEQARDAAFPLGVPEGFDQNSYGVEPYTYEDVTEGQIFDLGGRYLEVFFSPGHSEDGICLIDEANDLVLVGDLFYMGALYCQFASEDYGYSDPVAYRDSLLRLYRRIGDETRIFCCHNAFEADGRKIAQAAELFSELLAMLKEGGASSGEESQHSLNYGESGKLYQLMGDGFSVLYAG